MNKNEKIKVAKQMIEEFGGSPHTMNEGEIHTKSETVWMFEHWLEQQEEVTNECTN